jgi:hypothetical protein
MSGCCGSHAARTIWQKAVEAKHIGLELARGDATQRLSAAGGRARMTSVALLEC